jgi:cell division protein FtsN
MTRNPRVAARSAPPPEPVANAPLSLSPDASDRAPPPPAAARDNSPRPLTPPRVASAASSGEAGGYLVQVSSRRSEADAESSLRALQAKYAGVLGGQPHLVRRADLGAKGIYYRAMVGPFGSREQAIQLCSSLKAAGGDCVVQSN